MVTGDLHAVGIASGIRQDWGHFPVLAAASLDSTPSSNNDNAAMFDRLQITAGRAQYGTVQVRDEGSHIFVTLAAWRDEDLLGSHTHGIVVDPQPAATFPTSLLAGSHTAVVEARLVTGQPTTLDPDGTPLPVAGGTVHLDGTAEVRGTLSMATSGIDETGESRFPRRPTDDLAPYGATEIWVRRGIDLGGAGVLWAALGIYRIDSATQQDAPYGEITLAGSDRMATIRDSRLLAPRAWPPDTTLGTVVDDLIREIYPDAVIIWDDDTIGDTLGRQVVAEESRLKPLIELARSRAKIVYVDDAGAFRIEAAPAEDQIVWEVAAGAGGVLVQSARHVSRDGVHNAVVATGEGQDDVEAVRGVAVDRGPASPTRFGGPFGRVPRFWSSPLLHTDSQAQAAAEALLRRDLGAPYTVDFDAIVHPALRPGDAIRVRYRDGNREPHIIEVADIPLLPSDGQMSAATRQKQLIVIGALI